MNEKEKISEIFNNIKSNEKELRNATVKERKEKLKSLLDNINKFTSRIEEAIFADFGKPPAEVKLTEIFPLTSELKYVIRNLKAWTEPKKIASPLTFIGSSNKIILQPKGIVLIISPWNYPFQLAIGPLISAVAAGNGCVLKPSELSPNTSQIIAELIAETFDENEVTVIEGDRETAETLLSLPFNHIFFTGSTTVGKIVMQKAAQNLASVTLELGGKSPVVIDDTANLSDAAQKIAWGKFLNAGQTCIAPDYVLIHKNREEEFLNLLKESISGMYGNLDLLNNDNSDYTQIVNENHLSALKGLLANAVNKGATIKLGGNSLTNNILQPTILSNVSLDSEIMQNEIFGPILPIINYQSADEIEEIVARNPNPLALYIFSHDKQFTEKMITNIPSGGIAINDVVVHFANYGLPFGGINQSGFGKGHGYFGFKEFSHERAIMKQKKMTTIKLFYPPYSQKVKKLIDLVIKFF